MTTGTVESIHIAPGREVPMVEVREIQAIAGKGLDGDRYCTGNGEFKRPLGPAQQLSLIEAEAVEAAQREYGVTLAPGESRRNITTRGMALNHLVGREFSVGPVRVRGVKLCEPCGYLQKQVGQRNTTASLVHRGGLRAEVLSDGVIRTGDAIVV